MQEYRQPLSPKQGKIKEQFPVTDRMSKMLREYLN